MQTFSGLDYLKIDIANQYGYDKRTWDYRINWTNKYLDRLESFTGRADNKYLFVKAVKAMRDTQAGIPTGFIMGLDATASGLQCMALLSGCQKTARAVNLINTNRREDVYVRIGKEMGRPKEDIKAPLMTVFYGSVREPEKAFGKDTEDLHKFYDALYTELPGAIDTLELIQECWDPTAYEYNWSLPDGHQVNMKVFQTVDKKIEVDELDHRTFTFRTMMNTPKNKGRSLAANLVHSVDGYIAREVVRRCHADSVQVATIHDSFWTCPNDMNTIRRHFITVMAEIADSNLFTDILREITGDRRLVITKDSKNLGDKIRKCEYPLS